MKNLIREIFTINCVKLKVYVIAFSWLKIIEYGIEGEAISKELNPFIHNRFFKWANHGHFLLFIFVPLKQHLKYFTE